MYFNPDKTDSFLAHKRLLTFLDEFSSVMDDLMLRQTDLNTIYKLVGGLIDEMKHVNSTLIQDSNGLNPLQVLDRSSNIISDHFEKINSHYKRKKIFTSHPLYIAPHEIAVGTRFELERNKTNNVAIPTRIQSSYEYVSIVDTVKSLFKREDFKSQYIKYNSAMENEHKCVEGVFRHFCCGKKYKNTEIFQTNTNSLQIQIATDEFDPCNPLQSKAGSHKICAVYFVIRNMPSQFLSKLKNIYLVCLCNSNDLKTSETDFNNIWSLIVKDISYLENVGVDIGNNINVKGTLAYLSFDNLGGNSSLGLVESFQAFFYCRICELPKEKCQHYTKEDPKMIRSKKTYDEQILIVEDSEKVNYSQTKGVKRFCILNELKYFHFTENMSVDPMHDLNEGVIPFLMKNLFDRCIFLKIFTKTKLSNLIRFYDFGSLNSKNRPSRLELEKKNLGQNASQSMCLFLHLPFILSKFKSDHNLAEMWICVRSLLRICQIVYSAEITESDLKILENEIHIHLENMKKIFKINLIPKHHILTHYCNVIRLMGPVIHMSMMRFENKHRYFKDHVKKSNNFMNINKSLALKHQQLMCKLENTYKDEISTGAKKNVCDTFMNDHLDIFASEITGRIVVREVNWLRCNGITFKKGLLILNESVIFEIVKILCFNNEYGYSFFCRKIDNLGLDTYSNSLKTKQSSPTIHSLINFDTSLHKQTYEYKKHNEYCHLIADSLEIKKVKINY